MLVAGLMAAVLLDGLMVAVLLDGLMAAVLVVGLMAAVLLLGLMAGVLVIGLMGGVLGFRFMAGVLVTGLRDGDWSRVSPGDQLQRIRTATWNMVHHVAANHLLAGDQLRRSRHSSGLNQGECGESPGEQDHVLHDV